MPIRYIATVLLEDNCDWKAENSPVEGQRLAAEALELQSGVAVIRFDGGAELVMTGETSLVLRSAGSAELLQGDVVIRAESGAEGFVLMTPTSEVVDLGTEFAVKVGRGGETQVHVLEGEVSYRRINAEEELAKILRAGEGIAIDRHDRPRAIPMNSPRFKDFVTRINPKSRADLLTGYEGFNYSPGVLPLKQSTVGIGWNGPWRRRLPEERRAPDRDTSPAELEIVHGQMNVTWPVPGGRLGMLKLPPGDVFYVRPLQQAIDLSRDGMTYFSLMVREIERRPKGERPFEHLRLTFRSSVDYFGDALSFGHGPGYRPRIQASGSNLFNSPLEFPAEQTTLWIGKVVSRVKGEDEVYFRIYGEDETLDYAEPATWHVVTRNVDSDARLDRVLLSSTGQFGRIVDELRIGPTWRSVAPMREEQE
ncbi:FecR family protein [Rubinisphaera margarita]|uniref:FecR family protein n=1 Tax=Rubinisphaera margarita TaxID=2909586 RepID=UPI001EE95DBD|nr:FecR family protein [Rubinisphaera margarita]MCG6156355.1 FecR family protein [Rubinisphaera margarita]